MGVEDFFIPVICKAVCRLFREQYPLGRMFSRNRQTFFCQDDKELLKNLVQKEFSKHKRRQMEKEVPKTTTIGEDMHMSFSDNGLLPANPNTAVEKAKNSDTDLHNTIFSQDSMMGAAIGFFNNEMMVAKNDAISKGEGLTAPPANWPLFFDNGMAGPSPGIAAQLQKVIESVSEMQVTVDTTATTTTAEEKVEEKKVRNLDKKTAFSLRGLMEEMDLMVDRAFMPAIGKTVSAKFRQMCPDSETFSKKKITYFYLDDKVCLEKLVQEEHMKYMLRKVDDDFEQTP
jgi:hypothetical protein